MFVTVIRLQKVSILNILITTELTWRQDTEKKMLLLLVLLKFASAFPSGIYLTTNEDSRYFNPMHTPHTEPTVAARLDGKLIVQICMNW